MKANNLTLDTHSKKVSLKSVKIILKRLNINKYDRILILNNKIYIENKNMSGQRESRRQESVVRDGKTFEENRNIIGGNLKHMDTSKDFSIALNRNKAKKKICHENAQLSCLEMFSMPLRQINGNATPTKTNICRENLFKNKVETFLSHSIYNRDAYLKKESNGMTDGVLLRSMFTKSSKQLTSCSPPAESIYVRGLFLQKRIDLINHTKRGLRSSQTSCQGNNNVISKIKSNGIRKSKSQSTRKFLQEETSTKECKTCNIILERVDDKICLMDYLRLKPRVNTDVHKMYELMLLRRFNIKNCQVLIPRIKSVQVKE